MAAIRIRAGTVEMTATLNDSPTAQLVYDALPLTSTARLYGDEVYFDVPVHDEERDAQAQVPSGTVAFWPPGDALCIFFGQTPASPVNVIGTLDGEAQEFAKVNAGDKVAVERVE